MVERLTGTPGPHLHPDEPQIPDELPIFPSGETIVFPFMVFPVQVSDPSTVKLIDDAASGSKMIGVFAQKPAAEGQPPSSQDGAGKTPELYPVGTVVNLARMLKLPDGSVQILVQGVSRVRLDQLTQTEPYMRGRVTVLRDQIEKNIELEALARNLAGQFQRVVSLAPNAPAELGIAANNLTDDPSKLADFVAANINLSLEERQGLLETLDVEERLRKLSEYINREIDILEIGSKIQSQIKEEVGKREREFYLREQIKRLQAELGETDERGEELAELRRKVEEAELPPEARREADRELDRLSRMPPQAAEYSVATTYLEWLTSLPWNKSSEDNIDLAHAQQVLDEDHYDLEKVKDRILDYLAVRKLKADMRGPILCLVGPPGVGKTSLGQSIARALGRPFVRMSLGGVRDESELRGFRRTYVGALPGRIMQEIRRAGVNNPVFMLDEVDKLGMDFRGDPASALLEVLDPAQNSTFVDRYVDVAFDLSKVLFIATANELSPVPAPLLDRMEIIDLPGYTELQKLEIARRFLIPRQLKEHGLTEANLELPTETLQAIIREYTREAGVRNLERQIAGICRKAARRVATDNMEKLVVTPDDLRDYLGPARARYEQAQQRDQVGTATGLAWTAAGGDVLFVEASVVPGHGRLTLTGKLGDVMQESARAALTYARSRADQLGVPADFFEKHDLHIHVPAGAIPKDGPSAGITMATATISAMTQRPIDHTVGMTGEITLRGNVLPIGGLKEKSLAAQRAGLKTVLFPKENEPDLEEIPAQVREQLRFVPVGHMDEVLQIALRDSAGADTTTVTAPATPQAAQAG